ncbi:hypothetical protein JKP75_16985 [Blastococcus sp. TML/M2B]|uniref:hypothetical protein n=1 Tax=unclassified Blastococcus TaxID=2619396 RepID=UPI00190BB720|nr:MULTISPECIES: hypothetical protein [unclassified Blastococcus]MBN1094098.1 hypothetical protein [Blastococcus sp. TML/M2B]MBN1095782.1 hypothetical protein [Blastococcus sp. TML/C7B]
MPARRLVVAVVAGLLVGGLLTWLVVRDRSADVAAALPACDEMAGVELGALGEDPAWNGCLTGDGAAVQSYRYECSSLRESLVPRVERELADESAVVFLPDVGLMAAEGQPWVEARSAQAAFLRTPFAMSAHYRCDELRSLPPADGIDAVDCALDDVPLDLVTTQGCSREGEVHPAVGRPCSYPDFDMNTSWEQWSIEVPGLGGGLVLESGPDEQWWMVPGEFRDERCSTAPAEWADAWR